MGVKLETFLALEGSLSSRVVSAWGKVSEGILPLVYSRLRQNDVLGATRHVDHLDLSPIMRNVRDYVRYVAYAAIMSGVARLTPKLKEARILGSSEITKVVNRTTISFAAAINTSVADRVRGKMYDLIQDHDLTLPTSNFQESEGNVLFKAENATLLKPFTEFRNPINNEAQRIIQMISSLHTSRLANYGFTAEADLLGVTQYAITEQLDNKICPVCEEMHGKIFSVTDARTLLDRVLATDNPTELATLQPWPSQNKASLEALRGMGDREIVSRGWHIPPYHPWCRGQLVPVGEVPKIRDTGSYQAAFPEQVTGDFLPSDVDAETFETLGITLTEEQAKAWAVETGAYPDKVIATLTGKTPKQLADKAYDPIRGLSDSKRYGLDVQMLLNATDQERIRMLLDFRGTAYGQRFAADIDIVIEDSRRLMELKTSSGLTEASAGKMLAQWVAAAALVGIAVLAINPTFGSYGHAWSDFGAKPGLEDWNTLRKSLKEAIINGSVVLLEAEATMVLPLLDDDDPSNFWALTSLESDPVDEFISRQHLSLYIDLADPEVRDRFSEGTR